MPTNTKTQKRITKLNKALGLARMKLRYFTETEPNLKRLFELEKGKLKDEEFLRGSKWGNTTASLGMIERVEEWDFWTRLKFLFTSKFS